jgi:hypothetical protein
VPTWMSGRYTRFALDAEGRFQRAKRTSAAVAVLVAFFLLGRALLPYTIDFPVYYKAAQSLLAGRTDLYSPSFALDPPMRYVYPPVFVVLFAPFALLPPADAFGLWFALLAGSTCWVIQRTLVAWRSERFGVQLWIAGLLGGPFLIYGLRSSNVHLLVVLLTLAGALYWARGHLWRASVCWAFGGAVKVFPLLLIPVLLLLREWRLAQRTTLLSGIFWSLPVLCFGPQRAVGLQREWYREVVVGVERLRQESRLDVSLPRTVERLLTPIDYSRRIDARYPQVNLLALPGRVARGAGQAGALPVLVLSGAALLLLARARRARPADASAAVMSLYVSAQLILGPYTTLLYLSAWIVPALGLSFVRAGAATPLRRVLLGMGIVNLTVFLIPGGEPRRALEAAGYFTVMNAALWALSLLTVWRLSAVSEECGTPPAER